MRLYFVRHGESKFNAQGLHQHGKVELSDAGMRQARSIGKRFTRIPVDIIVASDYLRAKKTAEEIHKVTKKHITFTSLLQEVKRPSEIEGKPFNDPEAVLIKKQIAEHKHDPKWHYSDEENFFDFKQRCQEFLTYIVRRKEERIAVVSHGFVMRMIVGLMMFGEGFTQDQYEHFLLFLGLSNTGLTIVDYGRNKQWQLVTWNDFAHLGE